MNDYAIRLVKRQYRIDYFDDPPAIRLKVLQSDSSYRTIMTKWHSTISDISNTKSRLTFQFLERYLSGEKIPLEDILELWNTIEATLHTQVFKWDSDRMIKRTLTLILKERKEYQFLKMTLGIGESP